MLCIRALLFKSVLHEFISGKTPLPAAAARPLCGREGVQRSRANGPAERLRGTASPLEWGFSPITPTAWE